MKKQFLEAGQIVNTHGVRGEVRIVPLCDSPEFLMDIDVFYLEGAPIKLTGKRVHKGSLIAKPQGIDSANDAALLKGKILMFDRDDVELPEGQDFIADLIGLTAIDAATGESFGKVTEVFSLPSNDVYVIKGQHQYMIPAVSEYLVGSDIDGGTITFRLIQGMRTDEN